MRLFDFHKISELSTDTIGENKLMEVSVAGKRIGLLKKKDTIYAFSATCPHAGAPLCEGWLDAMGRIVCPLHQYRFDIATGRNTSGEGYKLFTYPVEIKDDGIYIGLPEAL